MNDLDFARLDQRDRRLVRDAQAGDLRAEDRLVSLYRRKLSDLQDAG